MNYSFWIFKDKLLGLLIVLTEIFEASFDKADYDAILYGLIETNSETGETFEYMFPSKEDLTIKLSKDSEDEDIIHLYFEKLKVSQYEKIKLIDQVQSYLLEFRTIMDAAFAE